MDDITRLKKGNEILLDGINNMKEKIAMLKANCLKIDPTLEQTKFVFSETLITYRFLGVSNEINKRYKPIFGYSNKNKTDETGKEKQYEYGWIYQILVKGDKMKNETEIKEAIEVVKSQIAVSSGEETRMLQGQYSALNWVLQEKVEDKEG